MALLTSQARRNNIFSREQTSPPPPSSAASMRPKSMAFTLSPPSPSPFGHSRNQSYTQPSGNDLAPLWAVAQRSDSSRNTSTASGTFAPTFIKTEEAQRDTEQARAIEGENDFSGKRYVWLRDQNVAFVKGWVVEELDGNRLLVQCDDGTVLQLSLRSLIPANWL